MHTRRIAAFILGAWLAGSLLVIFISMQNGRSVDDLLASPVPQAEKIIKEAGKEGMNLLLRHAANDETQAVEYFWERVEIVLAVALGGTLFLATQRRVFPLVLCGAMLVLVAFQHLGLANEIASLTRESDFPPGNTAIAVHTRLLALNEVYYAAEILKLAAGGVLASFLFVFRTHRSRREQASLDMPVQRAVNR